MIPALSLMIGMYIITRMFEILLKDETNTFVKVIGLITVAVAVFSLYSILIAGASVASATMQ